MWIAIAVLATLVTFAVASMVYVCNFRGAMRFAGAGEYLRKGWPIFAPLNCLLYACTRKRARRPIMDLAEFPELDLLREHWQTFRDEALALHASGYFTKPQDPESQAHYDLGFRTFYKYGWSKFYLKWYGYVHRSAEELCPKTVAILKQVKAVNGAMFSVLPAGSKLTRHLDPVACSLRFHLGLSTPNQDACFIDIDGQIHSWRDGQGLLFDETYLHHARNDTDRPRIILMCDVERPLGPVGRIINAFNKFALRMSVVPNLEGDRRGLINRIFSTVSPLLRRSKALKQRNRPLYLLIKWSVNLLLAALALAVIAGLSWAAWWAWGRLTG